MEGNGWQEKALRPLAEPHQRHHHQTEGHRGFRKGQTRQEQAQTTAQQTGDQERQHPSDPMAQAHKRERAQKQQMVRSQDRMGQSTEQSSGGGGGQVGQVHQMVGFRWLTSQPKNREP
jgi:hypothetical protein